MAYTRANGKVTFSYVAADLVKDFIESGHNLVPIATGQDGHPLLEERSRVFPFIDDPDEVTVAMMERLWRTSYAEVVEELESLLPRSVTGEDGELSGETNATFDISIWDDNLYNEHDIVSLDRYIRERLIFGALKAWFRQAESGDTGGLVQRVEDNILDLRKNTAATLRRMALVLHRNVLRNPMSISVDIDPVLEQEEEEAAGHGGAIGPDYAPWTWHWPWPWNRN